MTFDFKVDIIKFYRIRKEALVEGLFFLAMFTVFLGSLHPWFLWPIGDLYFIIGACFALACMLIDNSRPQPSLSTADLLLPAGLFFVASFFIVFVNGPTIGYLFFTFASWVVMVLLLRGRGAMLQRFCDRVAKIMAVSMAVSLFFFLIYLAGFPLPSVSTQFNDYQYSYDNYFLFMRSDWSLDAIIPRFHSVFLEPGHLGTAVVLLLMTQFGRWRKWYNVLLIIVALSTFSLAAYALLVTLVFLNMWVQRQHILRKLLLALVALALVTLGAFTYNEGDNMLHDLIFLRLEVDEETGDMVGNNRVSDDFEKEFEQYITTTDIFLGRDMKNVGKAGNGQGNSGYRVFIYENGIIATFLVFAFYWLSLRHYRDRRYMLSAALIFALTFWIRGYPLWYSNLIPFFVTALQDRQSWQQAPKAPSLCLSKSEI